jgi:hypothetical protein
VKHGPAWLVVVALLPAVACGAFTAPVTVPIAGVGGSGVAASAVLTAVDGGTLAAVEATGLKPGSESIVALYGGNCRDHGASSAVIMTMHADAKGAASDSHPILFGGREQIQLDTLDDGEHILVLSSFVDNEPVDVACGTVPRG